MAGRMASCPESQRYALRKVQFTHEQAARASNGSEQVADDHPSIAENAAVRGKQHCPVLE